MGCCSSDPRLPSEAILITRIKSSIESNNLERLSSYTLVYENYPNNTNVPVVDKPIVLIKSMNFNALAYALWLGHLKTFSFLIEQKNANFVAMEEIFAKNHTSGLEIICKRGYLELLAYYLPIYEKNHLQMHSSSLIHKVCEWGNISILAKIFQYFQGKVPMPQSVDINSVNENGENCALVACRVADLTFIKFLCEVCKADFTVRDVKGRSCYDLLLNSEANKNKYVSGFEYLFKIAKVPLPDEFECTDPEIQKTISDKNN